MNGGGDLTGGEQVGLFTIGVSDRGSVNGRAVTVKIIKDFGLGSSSVGVRTLCKKASNHHANLPLEMYSFTL